MNTILEWHDGPREWRSLTQFRLGANDPDTLERFRLPGGVERTMEVQDNGQPVLSITENAIISTGFGAAASCKFRDMRQLFIYRLDGALSLIFVTHCASDEDALRKAEAIAGYGYRVELWSNGIRVHAR